MQPRERAYSGRCSALTFLRLAHIRKGRRAGGKKAGSPLMAFLRVSVYLMGAARGFLLRFQRIDLHFSSAASGGSRTRKVLNNYFHPGRS